ncbi:hypothetical protein [Sunxiuqinia indica]|uniref:hypothetical protein n=1 Tax=Sunxiuqinia indica TaxID=2692584 RepID=UPI00135A54C4|nr:hypothetical protein [Sunxiuqinia indica]
MKTLKINSATRKICLGVFVIMLLFSIESQAKKYKFLASSVVPAARGFAKITKDNNHNYVIKMKVTNLAEVKRLDSSKLSYVIWMVTDREETKNIGQLDSSSKFMPRNLLASFKTITSFTPIQIFITTEDEVDVQYPGSHILF